MPGLRTRCQQSIRLEQFVDSVLQVLARFFNSLARGYRAGQFLNICDVPTTFELWYFFKNGCES